MAEGERRFRKASELGVWLDEDTFEFFEPVSIGPGMVAKTIDASVFRSMESDLDMNQVIEALVNSDGDPVEVPAEDMVEVRCPDCGGRGVMPREVMPPGQEGEVFLRCPKCTRAAKN